MRHMRHYFIEQFGSHKVGQWGMYLLGCVLFSIGAKFFIDSNLGTDPLDVMVLGIVDRTSLSIGITSGLISIVFLFIWALLNKKFPPITPFITMFFIGSMIDVWNLLKIEEVTQAMFGSYVLLAIATLLAAYGSTWIIMSGIGLRVMDLLSVTTTEVLHNKLFSKKEQKETYPALFFFSKMSFEVFFIVSGILLGGPFGIGTIVFLIAVSPGIVFFMKINIKLFKVNNYGLYAKGGLSVQH